MHDNAHLKDHIVERMERIGGIGHWRWSLEDDHLFWSKGVYDIHGLDEKNYTPNVETALEAYVPEDRIIVESALAYAVKNKETYKIEARIKRPDGEIRHVITQGECETGSNGDLIAVFGVIQDLTAVKQQEELYQLSALGSNSALWDWDIEEDSLRWAGRSAQVLGYALNENLPKSTLEFFDQLLHDDDRAVIKQAFINHFTKLDSFNIEIRVKGQDGAYEWFISRAQAQFNDHGKAIRVCGSMTSIQALKETQEKLENSNSDLENFACMAAHEIKSPIRSIASYLELMRLSQKELPETFQDYMNKSIAIANETSYMVDELLEYASLQDAKLNLSQMSTEKVTKLIIRSMKKETEETGATFSFGNLPMIICDEIKIKTVITNLIQNALKYRSEAAPQIHIDITENDYFWQYSVKDNGRGMSQKDIDKAFTMFERSDNIGAVKGTGIGLAICERIIDLHHGEIWIESEINKGSIFHFTISKMLNEADG